MKRIALVISSLLIASISFAQTKFEKTSMARAAVELNCPKENIKVLRSAAYSGGALVVLNACDKIAYNECMGTVCLPRCVYNPKPVEYTGSGETDGKFKKIGRAHV